MKKTYQTGGDLSLYVGLGSGKFIFTAVDTTETTVEIVGPRAEEFAARSGHSLNTWLVNVVRAATRDNAVNIDIDLSSIPFLGHDPFGGKGPGRGSRRMSGWV